MSEMFSREVRKRTGSVNGTDPLQSFLYELMRDHLPGGFVEEMVRHVEAEIPNYPLRYTNGHLAKYAKLLADRLRQQVIMTKTNLKDPRGTNQKADK